MRQLAYVSLTINAPIDSFFNYVTNMENYAEWFPGVIEVKQINQQDPLKPGTRYSEIIEFAGANLEQTVEVIEVIQNRLFVTRGNAQPLLTQMKMQFTPQGDGYLFEISYFSRQASTKIDQDTLVAISTNILQRAEQGLAVLKEQFSQ